MLFLCPCRYRTQLCKDGTWCKRRMCFFAHKPEELRSATPIQSPTLCPPTPKSVSTSPMAALTSVTAPSLAVCATSGNAAPAMHQQQHILGALGYTGRSDQGGEATARPTDVAAGTAGSVDPVQDQEGSFVVDIHAGHKQARSRSEKGSGAHGGFLGYQQRRQVLSEGMATGAVACVAGLNDFTLLVHPDNAKLFEQIRHLEEQQHPEQQQPDQQQQQSLGLMPLEPHPPPPPLSQPRFLSTQQVQGQMQAELSALQPASVPMQSPVAARGAHTFLGSAPLSMGPAPVQLVQLSTTTHHQQQLLGGQQAGLQQFQQQQQVPGLQAVLLRSGQGMGGGMGYQVEEQLAAKPGAPGSSLVMLEDGTVARGYVLEPARSSTNGAVRVASVQQGAASAPRRLAAVSVQQQPQLQMVQGQYTAAGQQHLPAQLDHAQMLQPAQQPLQRVNVMQQPSVQSQQLPQLQTYQQQQQLRALQQHSETSMNLVQQGSVRLMQPQRMLAPLQQQQQQGMLDYQLLQPQLPLQDSLQVLQQDSMQVLLTDGSEELHDGLAYGSSNAPLNLLLQQLYLENQGAVGLH